VSLIAHSWGSIVAGHFAATEPAAVERLVMFGPICRRDGPPPMTLPAWRLVSLDDQWRRFVADVPAGETPVLSRRHFDPWGEAYLDSDPASRHRTPPSVQIPNGPAQDIADAWGGRLAYDPAAVRAPVLILRGAWDSLVTDDDAHGLFAALTGASPRRDVKLSGGTHLMHLEAGRFALYRETETFLLGET
jgi:pimeloyl-ACP methyl ester carboxylesterase